MTDARHPYANLPDHCFWKRSCGSGEITGDVFIGPPRFALQGRRHIGYAGSCFAQHIARYLRAARDFVVDFETAPPGVEPRSAGYDVFACRYGNIYTVRQLRELVEQALQLREPILDLDTDEDGRTWDLLRPRAVPAGFASPLEARLDREYHLSRVRAMFAESELFIFTLGLTEAWGNLERGHTYPMCPGTARGVFTPAAHGFQNFGFPEVLADLRWVIETLGQVNPDLHFLLTVSPVPLMATYTGQPVAVATTYSKSVLRAVCGQVVAEYDNVEYFPSFEMITSPLTSGRFFGPDRREVTADGVRFVMTTFFRRFLDRTAPVVTDDESAPPALAPVVATMSLPESTECDEILNDPADSFSR